jgi:hypothetical protein
MRIYCAGVSKNGNGGLTSLEQKFSKSQVYYTMYGVSDLVDPAYGVIQKIAFSFD